MCIIAYSSKGKIPESSLHNSLINNPDGWGFMVAHRGKLCIYKGLREVDFWPTWHERPSGPVVFHARIRSHGEVSLENCHPFRVPRHPELGIAHNGMIHSMPVEKKRSDTRIFIMQILKHLPQGFLESVGMRRLLASSIGQSKLVFLNGKTGRATIINNHMGQWFKGVWYSNCSFLPPQSRKVAVTIEAKNPEDTLFDSLTDDDRRIPAYYTRLVKPELRGGLN